MYWASRISNIGFQMAVPPLAGWWADGRWGTSPWLLIVGAGLGFLSGMLSILKLADRFETPGATELPEDTTTSRPTSEGPDGQH